MKSPLPWLAAIAALAIGAGAYFYYLRNASVPEPPPPVAAVEPAPKPPEAPRILHPVPEAPPTGLALPPLASSESLITETVTGLFGRESYARFFYPEGLVRRFVATIDNLPRKTASARLMPTKPVPGIFVVTGNEKGIEPGAENALRYRPYVLAMEAWKPSVSWLLTSGCTRCSRPRIRSWAIRRAISTIGWCRPSMTCWRRPTLPRRALRSPRCSMSSPTPISRSARPARK